MSSDPSEGASNNERLLAAARSDNDELLLEIFEAGGFDINFQDGASSASTEVLEHILSHEDCDVDPVNRLEGATPMHLALRISDPESCQHVVESLLDAGADVTIKDKNGDTAIDLAAGKDPQIRAAMRRAQAQAAISMDDVASDGEGDGDSGSASDDD
ncbi:hypothetical protein HGRIS_008724 [Hohenbuehelia grisea]|uniref:Peptidase A2 domain-containing protein n=1 Tax=Hohenbuehelia grisea TaxID=104357 RepID=A0ABR3J9E9_9AGAR